MAYSRRPDPAPLRTLPFAPVIAGIAAVAVAICIALLPIARIDAAVLASGMPALFPQMTPPLGGQARLALMVAAGGTIGSLLWGGLSLLMGDARLRISRRVTAERIDRTDAIPPRLRLAGPPPETPEPVALPAGPPVEQPLPQDLDVPMAAFDPAALPVCPAAPRPPLRALAYPPPPSVAVLLARLEAGLARRGSPAPVDSSGLTGTLAALRRMATRD